MFAKVAQFHSKDPNVCSLTCLNGGSCQIANGVQQCQCPCFYSGSNCQTCKIPKQMYKYLHTSYKLKNKKICYVRF